MTRARLVLGANIIAAKIYNDDCSEVNLDNLAGASMLNNVEIPPDINARFSNTSYNLVMQLPFEANVPYDPTDSGGPLYFFVEYFPYQQDGASCWPSVDYGSGEGPQLCANLCCASGTCGQFGINGCVEP